MSQHPRRDQRPSTPAPIGPARFQQPTQVEQKPDVVGSVGAALLLLLLVVGVPAALLWLGGAPSVPTSWPSREQLTETLGVEQLLMVLVWVAWLAWLQFTICVVVELRSALTGVGLPTRVPLAGPSQRFARTLVASVLLLVTAAGPATALTTATHAGPEPSVSSISQTVDQGAPAAQAPVEATEVAVEAEVTYQLGDMVLSPEEGKELVGKKVYVVEPPEGRYHDNLWDISERELGDGRRYQEVYELNKGRDQPDGHELSLARLIYPNWLLVMPEDAVHAERVVAVEAPAPVEEAPPAQEAPVEQASAVDAGSAATAEDSATAGSGTEAQEAGDANAALVGAGLLAAGLLGAVERMRRRRRTAEPSDEAVEVEVALRVGADPARAGLLDRSLRTLASSLQASGRDLPGVYSARVDDTSVRIFVSPAVADAPAPWRSEPDGRSWVVESADLAPTPRGGAAPFPGLVSLGRDETGADVLIDLEAAQGPIAVVGPEAVAHEVATALAAELATNQWSDRLRVTGVGLHDGLAALGPERYRAVASVEEVLPELAARQATVLGADVLSGRLRGSGASTWVPEYVVLAAVPAADVSEQLVALTATTLRSPLGVVCVGDIPGARWHLEVTEDGALSARLLDLHVQANRLSAGQAAAVEELLTAQAEPEVAPGGDRGRTAMVHEVPLDRPAVPEVARDLGPEDLSSASVRVQVLGAPRVYAPRPIEEGRLALSVELVVHLALHPEGVHPAVLGSALWPRGVTSAVREATIDRAVDWLGTDAAGRPNLVRQADGRLQLGPGVVLDWDVVASLLARSRAATSREQERSMLTSALALAQGCVLAERPAGRYSWLARARLERASKDLLVDAAHRLTFLCWEDEDPAAAQEAAWAGLRVAPTEEVLWRDLLRAAAALGDPQAFQDVAADMEATLHSAGVGEVSAQTVALVDELGPQGPRAVSGTA